MRARTMDVPLPSAVVLKRRARPKAALKKGGKWALLLALGFVAFAIAHRQRNHSGNEAECCATTAKAR